MKKYYIGTSGWQYPEWRNAFYPTKLPQRKWFAYYAEHFNTVEINATFYRYPLASTMDKWRLQAPEGFLYSLKVPRSITHLRQFRDAKQQIAEFYELASRLEDKLGAILFQLPERFHYSKENLARIIDSMEQQFCNVVEFRHESWWMDSVFTQLKQQGVAFCHVSTPTHLPQTVIDAENFYLRFHGTEKWFCGSHSLEEQRVWKSKIHTSGAKRVWIYFNNTMSLDALKDANTMKTLLL